MRQVCREEYSFQRKGRLFTKHDLLFDVDALTSQKKLSAVTCPTWRLVKPSSELEFMYSSRVLTCKDIITAISPFGSVIRRAKQPFNLVLCQIPFIDIPYLNVIVGFIALRLVGKLQFFAESAPCLGFQHTL